MKRRERYQYYPEPRRRKKSKKGFWFVLIILVGAIAYIYFSHGGSLNSIVPALKNITSSSSPTNSIQLCNQKVTDCGAIINSKYESSLAILKTNELNSTLGANEFLKTWGPASQVNNINYYDVSFPIVMVATRLDNSDGTKTPHVFICDSNGSLAEKSISGLC